MDFPLRAWHGSLQAFVDSAGEEGVLYVAMGTLATLGVQLPDKNSKWFKFCCVIQVFRHDASFTIQCECALEPLKHCAGLKERQAMAASFAALPVKVLWRLAPSEVPDEAALAKLGPGNNTKVMSASLAL